MKRIVGICLALVLCASASLASSIEEQILESSNSLQNLVYANSTISKKIIANAKAVVIIPASLKFSFFLGAKYGEGVASIKRANGSWSYPFFVKLTGGSVGFQFGFEKTDTLFIFTSTKSVAGLLGDKFTLGADASISIGPLAAQIDKSMEANMSAEIFTYSKASGAFVGASFEGNVIAHEPQKNRALYGNTISLDAIITRENLSDYYSVKEFLHTLDTTIQ